MTVAMVRTFRSRLWRRRLRNGFYTLSRIDSGNLAVNFVGQTKKAIRTDARMACARLLRLTPGIECAGATGRSPGNGSEVFSGF